MQDTLTIRVDTETKQRLEQLAKATDRTRSYLAAEAIRQYVELNEWQIQEIKQAVAEADVARPDEWRPHDEVMRRVRASGNKKTRKAAR